MTRSYWVRIIPVQCFKALPFQIAWFSALLIAPAMSSGDTQRPAHSKTSATAKSSTRKGTAKARSKTHGKGSAKTGRRTATAKRATSKEANKIVVPAQPRFPAAAPGSLQALVHAYREKSSAANAGAIERYARDHGSSPPVGLAFLGLTAAEVEHGDYENVAAHAEAARKRLPELSDYAAFFEASAYAANKQSDAVERALKPLWNAQPLSPMAANAAVLQARSYIDSGKPGKALSLLKKYSGDIPAPRAALVAGQALEVAGRKAEAVQSYREIFYNDPLAGEAGAAAKAVAAICADGSCAGASGEQIVSRAQLLFDGGQPAQARTWLEGSLDKLSGARLDEARVLIGACKFSMKEDAAAFTYLKTLEVKSSEADAERLYYLVRVSERLERSDEAMDAIRLLAKNHAASEWREQALIAEANRQVVDNSPAEYAPLFKACYEGFPDSSDAGYCHWRVVWSQYLQNRNGAEAALKTHLTNYPKSVKANAALYFLGRISETSAKPGAARAWYSAVVDRYPNSYYAVLARERLRQPAVNGAAEAVDVEAFLKDIRKPIWPAQDGFEPSATTTRRIARARLLDAAGLEDYADRELRFGAENDGQPQVIAMELAGLASRRGAPDQAIRYIKRYVPNYLNLPLDAAPEKFWQLAFPLPYRRSLEQYCGEYSLDPYFVAALVRQESEFNARAVSYAKALGLTQVMPSTGRYLSRKLNISRFHTALLFEPDINLRIGAYYIRALLDGLQGSEEAALASYNAGKSRVNNWLTWSNYREPAEFVESIPFIQTRDYVQIVLHNADIYRRLYGAPHVTALIRNRPDNSSRLFQTTDR